MMFQAAGKLRIGISSCLLGQKVRYDGQHKRDDFLTNILGPFVEWVPVCPEVDVGMGVPRDSVRLVGLSENPRLVSERSGNDWTERMQVYAAKRVRELSEMSLCGYILKKDSPSCGLDRVRVYPGPGKAPHRGGRGMFTRVLIERSAILPIEDEGRLNDAGIRENFIERIFAFQRLQSLLVDRPSIGRLVEFQARHKLVLTAHSDSHLRRLGRITAQAKGRSTTETLNEYAVLFMEALRVPVTRKKSTNVLQHAFGYFSDRLTPEERREMLGIIRDYHCNLVPLVVPITLLNHYVRKYNIAYLLDQHYLNPHPKELMLRNHV